MKWGTPFHNFYSLQSQGHFRKPISTCAKCSSPVIMSVTLSSFITHHKDTMGDVGTLSLYLQYIPQFLIRVIPVRQFSPAPKLNNSFLLFFWHSLMEHECLSTHRNRAGYRYLWDGVRCNEGHCCKAALFDNIRKSHNQHEVWISLHLR